jgi:sugar/nucleoside kinase (ribokinase family)
VSPPDRLASLDPGRVLACPDGSVDEFVHVHDAAGRVTDRAAFGRRIADGERSYRFVPQRRAPGGQAVTAARQAHALGAEVTLFGHCDDPTFELPFDVRSLGAPAEVTVCTFPGSDLMFATDGPDLADCDAAILREAGAYDAPADAAVVTNAVSVPRIDEVLRGFRADDAPLVFDPGPITGIGADRAAELRDALRALGERRPVVVSPNREETRAFAAALDVDGPAGLRDSLGVEAVVVHSDPTTTVATADGSVDIDTPDVKRVGRTGGGDCFVGALATALSGGWSVREASELGVACAAYRVATAEVGDREALR